MAFPKWMRMKYGKRVRWTCERCGRQFRRGWMVEFHHKTPTSSGGRDTFENMECLCVRCHWEAHVQLAKEGYGSKRSPRIIKKRLERSYGGRTRKWIREHT